MIKVHFVGIGGIGISALAQYYLEKGYKISGSDLSKSEITDLLKSKGAKIFIGNSPKNISNGLDLVVYSPAVKSDNPEIKKAKELGINIKSYPQALGELTKNYFTIAVAGAHGKSTTTSMLGILMQQAKLDPTVIVGTMVKEFGNSNFRFGKSKFLVIEACEYDCSFLEYYPDLIILTNIDKEHLDYFKTFAGVKKAFKDFVNILSENKLKAGEKYLVINKDNDFALSILPKNSNFNVSQYSIKQKDSSKLKEILKVPGQHNLSNAMAVLQTARILGIPDQITFKSLGKFKGTWRRFDILKKQIGNKKITIISDYGHHPNEIKATLQAAKEKYPNKKIWCIFQPHQYQRTFYLFDDFVKMFKTTSIHQIAITDIYDVAGREVKDINQQVSSELLVKKINSKNIIYFPTNKLENYIKENICNGDVLIIMGAGNIYDLLQKI